jgi:hypothetical protein
MLAEHMIMKTGLALAFVLASTSSAFAQDAVIGLLSLPEVFGDGPCDKFSPREVSLYPAPESDQIVATIRIDKYWTFPEVGGCEGLRVTVHDARRQSSRELPTKEYEYEAPAAIVLQQRGRWFKVRLSDGAAWLHASDRNEYFPLERLLTKGLTYLTDASDGQLRSSAGAVRDADGKRIAAGGPVRVRQFRRVGEDLWVNVQVLSHSLCESRQEPVITAEGWLPAHSASGEPTIWFYSRGC